MEPEAEKDLSSRSVPGAEKTQKGLEIDDTLLRQSPEGHAELKEVFFPTGNARFEKTKLAFFVFTFLPFLPLPLRTRLSASLD